MAMEPDNTRLKRETARTRLERWWRDLAEVRLTWDQHYVELAEYILPRTSRYLLSGNTGIGRQEFASARSHQGLGSSGSRDINWGGKKNDRIIDGTPMHALSVLTAGLMSGITSPSRKWFRLLPPRREMMKDKATREWIKEVERVMFDMFEASNLYQVLVPTYEELAVYGTAALGQFDDSDRIMRYENFSTGEYWLEQDHHHRVNTFFRLVHKTTEQMVREFATERGEIVPAKFDKLSNSLQTAWNNQQYSNQYWECLECVIPAEEGEYADGTTLKVGSFPFVHVVFEVGGEDGRTGRDDHAPKILQMDGFREFPIMSPRWFLNTPDVYGRSPGMEALGDCKQLQSQQRLKASAIAKMVNPPMLASPNMKNERMSTLPGDVTYSNTETVGATGEGFRPVYQVEPRLDQFMADMEEVRERIRRHFYADLFLAISNVNRHNVTATEIEQRVEERLLTLGPVLLRLDEDLLKPLIDRAFTRILEKGLVPEPPPQLQGEDLKVKYLSIVAQAQEAHGLIALEETVTFAYQVAAQQAQLGESATVNDKISADDALAVYAEARGIAPEVVRSDEELSRFRSERQRAAREAQEAERAAAEAEQIRNMGQVQTGPNPGDNVVSDMISAATGGVPGGGAPIDTNAL